MGEMNYADLTGDPKLVFDELVLGFRETMPGAAWLTDQQFIEGVANLIEHGFAKIRVTTHDDGFDAELALMPDVREACVSALSWRAPE